MTTQLAMPGRRVEIVEPSAEQVSAARAYFAAEAAEEAAREAYYASWGEEKEWGCFLRREETVRARQIAMTALRESLSNRFLGHYYRVDGRLFGWSLVGARYVFRVRGREDSESIIRRIDHVRGVAV